MRSSSTLRTASALLHHWRPNRGAPLPIRQMYSQSLIDEQQQEKPITFGTSGQQQQQQQPGALAVEFPCPVPSDPFHGISQRAFSMAIQDILLAPCDPSDVEVKPDGTIYLPEIKYRRALNRAFGPGAWCMLPRSHYQYSPEDGTVSVEYALYVHGRFVSTSWGEQDYVAGSSLRAIATALEGAKSNALMRVSKDLGIASELWDPVFINQWKQEHAVCVWTLNEKTNEKRKLWRRRDRKGFTYPWKEVGPAE